MKKIIYISTHTNTLVITMRCCKQEDNRDFVLQSHAICSTKTNGRKERHAVVNAIMSWINFFSAAEHKIRPEIHNTFLLTMSQWFYSLFLFQSRQKQSPLNAHRNSQKQMFCSHFAVSISSFPTQYFETVNLSSRNRKKWRIPFYLLVFDFICSSRFWFSNL